MSDKGQGGCLSCGGLCGGKGRTGPRAAEESNDGLFDSGVPDWTGGDIGPAGRAVCGRATEDQDRFGGVSDFCGALQQSILRVLADAGGVCARGA